MKKAIFILISIVVWFACSEDKPVIPKISGVSFSTFTDERDSSVYRCVTIGNQTWMAENLHYRMPWGSFSGCYSYYEKQLDTLSFKANALNLYNIVRAAVKDKVITDVDGQMTNKLLQVYNGTISARTFVETYRSYPDVYNFLLKTVKDLEMLEREPVAASTLIEAERVNGGYKDKFGYLYSYEAAKDALPPGWDLPTDEDWKILEKALGMSEGEANQMEAWRGNYEGLVAMKGEQGVGLDVLMGGGRLYGRANYASPYNYREANAYFWTATQTVMNDSTNVNVIRKFMHTSNQIYRGTSKTLKVAYSVRGIKRE